MRDSVDNPFQPSKLRVLRHNTEFSTFHIEHRKFAELGSKEGLGGIHHTKQGQLDTFIAADVDFGAGHGGSAFVP